MRFDAGTRRSYAGTLWSVLGAAKQKQAAKAPERADALAGIVLLDHDGAEVTLGELWSERPAALVWLRHYG